MRNSLKNILFLDNAKEEICVNNNFSVNTTIFPILVFVLSKHTTDITLFYANAARKSEAPHQRNMRAFIFFVSLEARRENGLSSAASFTRDERSSRRRGRQKKHEKHARGCSINRFVVTTHKPTSP